MTDPLSLLPLAVAAGAGTLDGRPASQYVTAGLTLLQRSAPLVRCLSGRRAGILLPTSAQYLTALAGCEGRGAVLMNPLASPAELAAQIADAGVGAVFTNALLAPRLPPGTSMVLLDDAPRAARVVAGSGARDVELGSHFPLTLEGDRDARGSDEEVAIVYTSAMHGRPLGAILTHHNLLANARATVAAAALTASDHALAVLPASHLFGLVVSCVAPLLAGGAVTTMARFHPARALEQVERGNVTMLVGVPAMFLAMLDVLDRRDRPLSAGALRLCICGGAALAPAVQERWRAATGIDLRQGYGLTEASPVCLFNRVQEPNATGTLGLPYPDVEVEIREPQTFAPVGTGIVGEICVRGETVFPGYVRAPGAPAPRGLEVRDGWLRTGDCGARRADGRYEFFGHLKAMFTRNGFNIYPRELEVAIEELAGVRRARVSAIPDALRENEIAVEVEGTVEPEAVRAWCEMRLSGYKQPSRVTVRAAGD